MTPLQSRQAFILYAEVWRSFSLGKIFGLLHCLLVHQTHQTFGEFPNRIMLEASCSAVKSGAGADQPGCWQASPPWLIVWGWVWCHAQILHLYTSLLYLCAGPVLSWRVYPGIAKSRGRISVVIYACWRGVAWIGMSRVSSCSSQVPWSASTIEMFLVALPTCSAGFLCIVKL